MTTKVIKNTEKETKIKTHLMHNYTQMLKHI